MSTVKTAVRAELLNGVAKQAGVEELARELETKRAGMYVHGIKAAIKAEAETETREEAHALFVEVADTLADDFRANRRGIAEKYKCEQQLDKAGKPKVDEDDNPVYKVPSSLSTMRYVINSAFENGVEFTVPKRDPDGNPKVDADGNPEVKPAAFTAVRDAAKAARDKAKAEKAKAERTPDDEARDALNEMLDGIRDRIADLSGDALKAAALILQETAESIDKAAA